MSIKNLMTLSYLSTFIIISYFVITWSDFNIIIIGLLIVAGVLVFIYSRNQDENKFIDRQAHGYHKDNPIDLFLLVCARIQIYGFEINLKEEERIKKYLKGFSNYKSKILARIFEFMIENKDPIYNKKYFSLKKDMNNAEKLKLMQDVIRVFVSDKYLSTEEHQLSLKIANDIGLSRKQLDFIFTRFNYITEEDIKNQQTAKPSVNHGLQRAYSLLGLESTASFEEVKSAYRELVKIYHPDKQRGSKKSLELAKNQFQAISNAYELINDSQSS